MKATLITDTDIPTVMPQHGGERRTFQNVFVTDTWEVWDADVLAVGKPTYLGNLDLPTFDHMIATGEILMLERSDWDWEIENFPEEETQ